MEITKVSIRHVDMNKVKAVASITIDDEFVVHDLRIVEGEKGLFVAMPSRKLPNGEYRDVAHPINTATRERLQDAVIEEYQRAAGESRSIRPDAPIPAVNSPTVDSAAVDSAAVDSPA